MANTKFKQNIEKRYKNRIAVVNLNFSGQINDVVLTLDPREKEEIIKVIAAEQLEYVGDTGEDFFDIYGFNENGSWTVKLNELPSANIHKDALGSRHELIYVDSNNKEHSVWSGDHAIITLPVWEGITVAQFKSELRKIVENYPDQFQVKNKEIEYIQDVNQLEDVLSGKIVDEEFNTQSNRLRFLFSNTEKYGDKRARAINDKWNFIVAELDGNEIKFRESENTNYFTKEEIEDFGVSLEEQTRVAQIFYPDASFNDDRYVSELPRTFIEQNEQYMTSDLILSDVEKQEVKQAALKHFESLREEITKAYEEALQYKPANSWDANEYLQDGAVIKTSENFGNEGWTVFNTGVGKVSLISNKHFDAVQAYFEQKEKNWEWDKYAYDASQAEEINAIYGEHVYLVVDMPEWMAQMDDVSRESLQKESEKSMQTIKSYGIEDYTGEPRYEVRISQEDEKFLVQVRELQEGEMVLVDGEILASLKAAEETFDDLMKEYQQLANEKADEKHEDSLIENSPADNNINDFINNSALRSLKKEQKEAIIKWGEAKTLQHDDPRRPYLNFMLDKYYTEQNEADINTKGKLANIYKISHDSGECLYIKTTVFDTYMTSYGDARMGIAPWEDFVTPKEYFEGLSDDEATVITPESNSGKKFELVKENTLTVKVKKEDVTLYQIKALQDIDYQRKDKNDKDIIVTAGTLGGYVQSESNLSHEGKSWIWSGAKVYGSSKVIDDARVYGGSTIQDSTIKANSVVTLSTIKYSEIGASANVSDSVIMRSKISNGYFKQCEIYDSTVKYGEYKDRHGMKLSHNSIVKDVKKAQEDFKANKDNVKIPAMVTDGIGDSQV